MDGSDFTLIGVDDVIAKLKLVDYEVKRKTGRSALRKAAQIIQKASQENARKHDDPNTQKSIADNVDIRWNGKLFKRTGNLGFRIGVKGGAKFPPRGDVVDTSSGAKTPEWRAIEFGTSKQQAQPFMRPALENNIDAATNEFATQFEKGIDRAIKRAAKKK